MPKRKREYLIILDKAKSAAETAVDSYNGVKYPYKSCVKKGAELLKLAFLKYKYRICYINLILEVTG